MVTDVDTEIRLEALFQQVVDGLAGCKSYYNNSNVQMWILEWYAPLGHMKVWLRPERLATGQIVLNVGARIKTANESPIGSVPLTDEAGNPAIDPNAIIGLIMECEPKLLENKS